MLGFHLFSAWALATVASACGYHVRQDSAPQFAPLPEASKPLPLLPGGYAIQAFGKGTYMVTDNSYQAIFLISDDGVIVVDCPPTIGHLLLYAIGNITSIPITHVIYSHAHADHIGGVFLFGDDVTTIGHIETARRLAAIQDPNRPVPKHTFEKEHTVRVGNQMLELSYKGENHLTGNIYIYAPHVKLLMLVDIVYPGWIPFSQLGQTKNVPGYIAAHTALLAYDFDHYVGGHMSKSGNRTDVLLSQQYVMDLKANCEQAIRRSATADPVLGVAAVVGPVVALNPDNKWAAFKVYLDTMAAACAAETESKWLGVLAAEDVFQFENAGIMIESLRIDYGVLGPFATV